MQSSSPIGFSAAAIATTDAIAARLSTDLTTGLSSAEAARRLQASGGNELSRDDHAVRDIIVRQFSSPFVWLLLAAAAVSALTGDPIDAGMIGLFMLINTGLGFYQEYRAAMAVRTLLSFWQVRAKVVRDGGVVTIPAREIVPGDLLRLQAGDRIPADARFVRVRDVTANESILTGESIEVIKTPDAPAEAPKEYYQATDIGFSGTGILTGEADAVVFATGKGASLGEIASLTADTRTSSAFEKEIASFSSFILKLVIATLTVMFAVNVALKGIDRIGELALFSIALTVGVIPEALPVVSTIALSGGALRMAKKKVIVKRLTAIDDLGSIDVLCTDKTGTITENVLQVSDVLSGDPDECLRHAVLGSSFIGAREKNQNNAFDLALWKRASAVMRTSATAARKIAEIPFDPVRRRNAVLIDDGGRRMAVLRGSADEVRSHCGPLADEMAIGRWIAERGMSGERVIAVAVKEDATEADLKDGGFRWLGLIAFHDPIKRSTDAAIRKAEQLGVQIKILTGDSREVAGAVAAKLRLIDDPLRTVTGAELDAMDDIGRHEAVERFHVFARMNPKQKFAVLAILQEKHVVGFLGEGFNDAPGLKLANVGLAVEGASDIAREAADVILLNQSLSVIFDGIEEGRRTFANTIKYLKITLASNFGNFYSVAVASFFIPYLPMLPLQILLLNLLTDFPMITIAGDTVDGDDLRQPRKYDARQIVIATTILGLVSSIFDFATFALFRRAGEHYLQTVWFVVSALTEIALIYSLRTVKPFFRAALPPPSIVILTGVSAVVAVVLPLTPIGAQVFHFVTPTLQQMLIGLALVAGYLATTEVVKQWLHRKGPGDIAVTA